MKENMAEAGLRILAEVPALVSTRVANHRARWPEMPAQELAQKVVAELNEGQRWAIAVASVTNDVTSHDRAHVRSIEKESVRRGPREKVIDLALVKQVRAEMSEVRAMAERDALRLTVELTTQLLNASIRLGDGTKVKIGDATLAQHEARIEMLDGLATGNAQTLARHIAIANRLRTSGRTTLREVTK